MSAPWDEDVWGEEDLDDLDMQPKRKRREESEKDDSDSDSLSPMGCLGSCGSSRCPLCNPPPNRSVM